jgi:hypothetical protein
MTASKEKEMKEMTAEMTVRLGSRDRKLADTVESKTRWRNQAERDRKREWLRMESSSHAMPSSLNVG